MNNNEIKNAVKNISEGVGNHQDNINILRPYGEKAIMALLNAKSTHIQGYRDRRDSVTDILGGCRRNR